VVLSLWLVFVAYFQPATSIDGLQTLSTRFAYILKDISNILELLVLLSLFFLADRFLVPCFYVNCIGTCAPMGETVSYKRIHILYTILLLLLMCVGFCVQSRYEMHEQGQCISRYFVTASCSDTFVIIIVMMKVMITNTMTLTTPLLLLLLLLVVLGV